KNHVPMSTQIGARTSRDVEHSSETVSVFGGESAGHQVHSFEDLRTHARAELRLCIFQKRHTVDEFMQRELSAANRKKIIVAIARPRHQVIHQVIGREGQRNRQSVQILLRERVGTAGLFWVDGEIFAFHLDGLLHSFLRLQVNSEGNGLAGAHQEVVLRLKKTLRIGLESVSSGFNRSNPEVAIGSGGSLISNTAFSAL